MTISLRAISSRCREKPITIQSNINTTSEMHILFFQCVFPYAETEAAEWEGEGKQSRRKPIPVPAGEMIDMGAFLVMYKNVALIAARWCGRACRKMPRPSQVPQFPPSPANVPSTKHPPPPTHKSPVFSLVYKLRPLPTPCSRLGTRTYMRAHTHTRRYVLKFNQMLNYILTWVLTSWLYSPASD